MKKRIEGFYWCRPPESSGVLGWGVAYWTGISWYFRTPWGELLSVGEIGPRIPTPSESWQMVPKEPTKAMRMEFHRTNEICDKGNDDGSGSPDYQWKAMLAAAPLAGRSAMIMISSEAGVRMAKAGKALEGVTRKYMDAVCSPPRERELLAECVLAQKEFKSASDVVLAELYEQNLHNMTGP